MTEAIPPAQRKVLDKLAPLIADAFYLAGGAAIAARLHHRQSRDLDLFSAENPVDRITAIEGIEGATIIGRARGTIHLAIDGVPVSLLQYPYPMLQAPERVEGLPIPLASVADLACMKLSAIAGRGIARDFWDLHALMAATGDGLTAQLAAFRRKYPVEDVGHVIRSLAYFGDAESQPLPEGLSAVRWKEIRRDFETWVADLVAAG